MATIIPLLAAAALLAAPSAQETAPGGEGAPRTTSDWLNRFYEHQRADLLPDMVARLDGEGILAKGSARPPVSAFLSVVLRRPDVRAEAFVEAAEVGPAGRRVLLDALWLAGNGAAAERIALARGVEAQRYREPPPDLLKMPLESPSALDMLWGAFLASGDTAYPRRIVDLLDLPEGARGDSARWTVLAGAARWSLGSNARQHAPILRLVQEEAARRTGPAREVLAAIVAENAPPPPVPAPDPAPEGRMTRLVWRDLSPDVPKGSFGTKPKTLYRLGEKYARLEEEPDPEKGIHGLIVVSEPRVWMINLANMTGQHVVDPGPTFVFHAPVIPPSPKGEKAPEIEFGLEHEFLRAHGATRREAVVGGKRMETWTAKVDGHVITLYVLAGADRPVRLKIERKGKTLIELEYPEYERDLAPRMELFVPPAGVRYREAK